MIDLKKTQHYTTRAEYILQGLVDYIPKDAKVIEPFVGEGDLLGCFPKWECLYDIEPSPLMPNAIQQDTLKNPPDYKGRWVITNPPFLAKNKAADKSLFLKYGLDDLYKITLHTLLESEGGVIIVPLNFITDEYSDVVRKEFLSKFKIDRINVFKTPVFPSTTYSVCAFAFHREENTKQNFICRIPEEEIEFEMFLSSKYGYRYGGEIFAQLDKQKNYFSRLLKDREPEGFITNLKLYGLDTRTELIHITYESEYYYGKPTDRIYLTFVCLKELDEGTQKLLAEKFNIKLNEIRKQYHNLILTNYRDYNRKRIGFDLAYKLLSYLLDN